MVRDERAETPWGRLLAAIRPAPEARMNELEAKLEFTLGRIREPQGSELSLHIAAMIAEMDTEKHALRTLESDIWGLIPDIRRRMILNYLRGRIEQSCDFYLLGRNSARAQTDEALALAYLLLAHDALMRALISLRKLWSEGKP